MKSFKLLVVKFFLLGIIFSVPAFSNQEQAQQGGDEGGIGGGALAFVAVGGDGDGDDHERTPSSTRYTVPLLAYSVLATLALLGVTGGWIGEHYTRSDCNYTCVNGTFSPENRQSICDLCHQLTVNLTQLGGNFFH